MCFGNVAWNGEKDISLYNNSEILRPNSDSESYHWTFSYTYSKAYFKSSIQRICTTRLRTKNIEDGANCHPANSNNKYVEWTSTMDTMRDEKCWLFIFFLRILCDLRRYMNPDIAHAIQCVLEFSIETQIDSIWSRIVFFSARAINSGYLCDLKLIFFRGQVSWKLIWKDVSKKNSVLMRWLLHKNS